MMTNPVMRLLARLLLAMTFLTSPAVAAEAAELVFVHEPGCAYCRKWEREIGPAYPNTAAGRTAPLRPVHIRDVSSSGLSLVRPVRYTPTFILIADGSEIGRIEGYPGEDFFWGLLERLLEKLDPPPRTDPGPAVTRTSGELHEGSGMPGK